MEAIILAGGLGTRLRDTVPDLPKPMAPVAGRPFLAYLLDQLVDAGFAHVILSVGYLHEKISTVFGASYRDASISYSIEEQPLGTGGALQQALTYCRSQHCVALNGDSYCEVETAALLSRIGHAGFAMVLQEVDDTSRYGRVVVDNDHVVGFTEKGVAGAGLINAGIYGLSQGMFAGRGLPAKFSFEADYMMPLIGELRPPYMVASGIFIDIGVPEDYARAQTLFARS